MKIHTNNRRKVFFTGVMGLVSFWLPVAASGDDTDKWYLGGEAGVNFQQNVGGLKLGGISIPGDAKFDPGTRVDLNALYNVTEHWAIEYDIGFTYNKVSKIGGLSLSDANLWQVPTLVNGIYKYSFNDKWQGYGGVGIGAVISVFDSPSNIAGATVPSSSDNDLQFGYQAMLGLRYFMTKGWECDLGYKFLGTLDHSWNLSGVKLETDPTFSHSILVSLTHTF